MSVTGKLVGVFKRSRTDEKAPSPDDPDQRGAGVDFVLSQRAWNEIYANEVVGKRRWREAFYIVSIILLFTMAALAWLGAQSKILPHVVVTDKERNVLYSGIVRKASTLDDVIIKKELSQFIKDFRLVSPDKQLMLQNIKWIYGHLRENTSAYNKINSHFSENDPFKIFKEKTRIVKGRVSILPVTKNTWSAEWFEEERNEAGDIIPNPSPAYKAIITIAYTPPKNKKEEDFNPFGLWVVDIEWENK